MKKERNLLEHIKTLDKASLLMVYEKHEPCDLCEIIKSCAHVDMAALRTKLKQEKEERKRLRNEKGRGCVKSGTSSFFL